MNYEMPCNPVPAVDIPDSISTQPVSVSCETVPSAAYPVFIDLWL